MQLIRPKVVEHSFCLFGRSVHPELFQIHKQRLIERSQYQLRIDITSDGHVLTFKSGTVTMSEVICSATQLLPSSRQMITERFAGRSVAVSREKHHVRYDSRFELERVTPQFFWTVQEQLGKCYEPQGLCQCFNSSGRLPWGGLSYVTAEERQRSVVLQSIHTFPDDYQLLKVCTTFAISDDSR